MSPAIEDAMKGPAARWKHDVRRIWECPTCQRRERSGGDTVFLSCDCLSKSDPPRTTWMRLMEESIHPPHPASESKEEPPSQVGLQEPLTGADPPQ